MNRLLFPFLFVLAACSTSSSSSSQPIDCSPISHATKLDQANDCYDVVPELDGICRQPVSAKRALGIENVCAVKAGDGALYVLTVDVDERLSGAGWTFGPRAEPDLVQQPSTLSATDESRCALAPQVTTASLCSGDAD